MMPRSQTRAVGILLFCASALIQDFVSAKEAETVFTSTPANSKTPKTRPRLCRRLPWWRRGRKPLRRRFSSGRLFDSGWDSVWAEVQSERRECGRSWQGRSGTVVYDADEGGQKRQRSQTRAAELDLHQGRGVHRPAFGELQNHSESRPISVGIGIANRYRDGHFRRGLRHGSLWRAFWAPRHGEEGSRIA